MKCHYEVLGLNLNATDEEIKKSYRKNALLWHPDKNPDSKEEAHQQFLLVQQAYDVLSDPQERSWYDKHREDILRGGLGKGDQYEDKSLNVYQYFNASCYSGYEDDIKGFYKVYSDVFKLISEEDVEFIEQEPNMKLAPEFGSSTSSYEEVVGPFYSYWDSYSTAKSYVWVDKYDIRQAPNRQIRRAMEQENKKLRDKARKNRNEEIRALVAFVKKRDKRVKSYNQKLKDRALEIKKLAEEKKERDRKKRTEQMKNYKEASWSAHSEQAIKELERLVDDQFGDEEDSEDEDDVCGDGEAEKRDDEDTEAAVDYNELDELYCPVCNKEFKSKSTHENHKKSKKHLANLEQLVLKMKHLDDVIKHSDNNDNAIDDKDTADNDVDKNGYEMMQDDQNSSTQTRGLSKKQKKKRKMQKRTNPTFEEEADDDIEDENAQISTNKDIDAQFLSENISAISIADEENEQKDEKSTEEVQSSSTCDCETDVKSGDPPDASDYLDNTTQHVQLIEGDDANLVNVNTKKQTSCKKQTTSTSNNKTKSNSKEVFTCNVCKASFQTRNKLFDHIKTEGHALKIDNTNIISQQQTTNSKKTKTKKSKS